MSYDPTVFGSADEAAANQAAMEREFGMPRQAHSNSDEVGRRVNKIHHDADAAMNDDLGWGRTTRADLRRKWRQD